jgi:hypothetical protein
MQENVCAWHAEDSPHSYKVCEEKPDGSLVSQCIGENTILRVYGRHNLGFQELLSFREQWNGSITIRTKEEMAALELAQKRREQEGKRVFVDCGCCETDSDHKFCDLPPLDWGGFDPYLCPAQHGLIQVRICNLGTMELECHSAWDLADLPYAITIDHCPIES